MASDSAAPAATVTVPVPAPLHAFDRAAVAILGAMVSLILVLTAVLLTVSSPPVTSPAPTAQTSPPPHRA
jgi:hypothetical protein